MLWIEETFVDADRRAQFGDRDAYETRFEKVGELFRFLQAEYGRCASKVYIDQQGGSTVQVGWTFSKRMRYEDADTFYTREVWVTVLERPDTVVRTKHYKVIG